MSWKTWSPFQSEGTKAICAHMTEAEKLAGAKRGALYGIWVAFSFAIPVSVVISHPSPLVLCLASLIIVLHLLYIPIWQRKQREFLCNTEWAKSQGFKPEKLKLFGTQNSEVEE